MAKEYSNLEKVRLEKADQLREQGIDPYPAHSERSHSTQKAIQEFESSESSAKDNILAATLVGRIRSMRAMGKITFAHIEDGAGRVQLFLRADDLGQDKFELFNRSFDLGDFIQATGEMFRTRTGEVTLRVSDYQMLAKAITPLPAAKDEMVDGKIVQHATLAEPEVRYRQRYADLAINSDVRRIFRSRAAVIRSLRDFLDSKDFLEVETPILQPIYGGAAARPFVTFHNQLKQDLYLRISFELYLKRLLVGNLERVYEIGRDFRNEGVDRTHNPEFTMLEFYMAYADYHQVMALTEEMIAYVAAQVIGSRKISYQGHEINLEPPWTRMKLSEGLQEMAGVDIEAHPTAESLAEAMRTKDLQPDPKATRGKLIDSLIGDFLEPNLLQPTFVYDYPRDISPLTKSKPEDANTVERFEAFIAGMEICNAFSELNDPLDQEARFQEMGRDYTSDDEERHPMDEDYLRAMRYGMPPNGGFGMGVDRLTMLLTDTPNIREVILFPHLRERE
ncbi:MAG: lysine--tRNA ligase [Anaerolineales bacterium]